MTVSKQEGRIVLKAHEGDAISITKDELGELVEQLRALLESPEDGWAIILPIRSLGDLSPSLTKLISTVRAITRWK